MKDFINIVGGWMMAFGYPTIGIFFLLFSRKVKSKFRRNQVVLFGIMVLTSGISRGLIELHLWNTWVNALLKFTGGTCSIIAAIIIPAVLREFLAVQTIEETQETLIKTREIIEKLDDISEKINIRNPR